jgi:MFS family permease
MKREPLPSRLAAAVVFVASGAVLVLEIVGLRLVGPYVGITLQTSSAVIGVALASIGYGAWTGGWLADRLDARRLLAPALLLAAVATAFTVPIVRYAGALLRGTDATSVLLLAVLAVFVPGALLSAITPLVVKLQLGDLNQTGRVVGRLSSLGTLGAITATFGTGFVLVAALPTSTIVVGLAGVLAAAGLVVGWYVSRPSGLRLPGAVGALAGFAGVLLAVTAPDPCDVETAYHCATVLVDRSRPTGRILYLNGAQHSYVDIADPRYLRFAYTQWIGASVDTMAPAGQPLRALHVGGGGFTLPEYLAATRPGSDSLVLEIDADLVALDRRRVGLRTGPNLRVVAGDARVNLARQPSGDQDLVIGDAFGHLVVPWHLTTREFVADVHRVLRPDGVFALNVIDRPSRRLIRAEVATVASVFANVLLIAPPSAIGGETSSNFVVLASDRSLPIDALRGRLSGVTVLSGADLNRFADHARVLTDDYAPVDQLLQGGL